MTDDGLGGSDDEFAAQTGHGDGIEVVVLADRWEDSTDSPLSMFEFSDPPMQGGTVRIAPGKRVPAEGWTSHGGPEVSLLLSGRLRVVTRDCERIITDGAVSIIPEGVDHYSVNPGPNPADVFYVLGGNL